MKGFFFGLLFSEDHSTEREHNPMEFTLKPPKGGLDIISVSMSIAIGTRVATRDIADVETVIFLAHP